MKLVNLLNSVLLSEFFCVDSQPRPPLIILGQIFNQLSFGGGKFEKINI